MSNTLSPKAPQYAQALDLRARKAEARVEGLEEALTWLRSYLTSPKFASPSDRMGSVNVQDVLARLDAATTLSLDYEAMVI